MTERVDCVLEPEQEPLKAEFNEPGYWTRFFAERQKTQKLCLKLENTHIVTPRRCVEKEIKIIEIVTETLEEHSRMCERAEMRRANYALMDLWTNVVLGLFVLFLYGAGCLAGWYAHG